MDNAIYCIGDAKYFLMYDYKNSQWHKIFLDLTSSDYKGDLKFTSICMLSAKKREYLMSGGCNKENNEAVSTCFKFMVP